MRKKIITLIVAFTLIFTSISCTIETSSYDSSDFATINFMVDTRRYYYTQLSIEEKEMYDTLSSSKEDIMDQQEICIGIFTCQMTEEEILEKANNYFLRVTWAYILDNPEATLWFNSFRAYISIKRHTENTSVSIIIAPKDHGYYDFENREELQNAIEEVEEKTKKFVSQLSGTDKEKLQSIHNWLLQDAKYDESISHPNISNLFGCIIQKEAICGGFSYSLKYVADMAGIDVITVLGSSYKSEENNIEHAWNMCYIDGEWHILDLTYNLDNTNSLFFEIPFDKYTFYHTLFDIPVKTF